MSPRSAVRPAEPDLARGTRPNRTLPGGRVPWRLSAALQHPLDADQIDAREQQRYDAYYAGGGFRGTTSYGDPDLLAGKLIQHFGTGPLLDAGCGSGQLVTSLRARGVNAVGVEYSRVCFDEVLSHAPAGWFHQGSIVALPFEDGAFATVTCFDVLEHLPEAWALPALRELLRVCRGKVLATISLRPSSRNNAFHRTVRSRGWWEALIGAAGGRFCPTDVAAWQPRAEAGAPEVALPHTLSPLSEPLLTEFCAHPPFFFEGQREPWYFVFEREGSAVVLEEVGEAPPAWSPRGPRQPVFLAYLPQDVQVLMPLLEGADPQRVILACHPEFAPDPAAARGTVDRLPEWLGLRNVTIDAVLAEPQRYGPIITAAESNWHPLPVSRAVLEARLRGVPTLTLQHGIWTEATRSSPLCFCSERFALWGQAQRDFFLQKLAGEPACLNDPATFVVTGAPRYDALYDAPSWRPPIWKRAGRPLIALFANTHWRARYSPEHVARIVAEFTGAARALGECDFVLKLHPFESPETFAELAGLANGRVVTHRVAQALDLTSPELIAESDAVVATLSTVLLEAAILNKPALCLDPSDRPVYAGITPIRRGLAAALRPLLAGNAPPDEAWAAFARAHSHGPGATRRVRALIDEMTARPAEDGSLDFTRVPHALRPYAHTVLATSRLATELAQACDTNATLFERAQSADAAARTNYERALSAEAAAKLNYEQATSAEAASKANYERALFAERESEERRQRIDELGGVRDALESRVAAAEQAANEAIARAAELEQAQRAAQEALRAAQAQADSHALALEHGRQHLALLAGERDALARQVQRARDETAQQQQRLRQSELERNYYRKRWPPYAAKRAVQKLLEWRRARRFARQHARAAERFGEAARLAVLLTGLPPTEQCRGFLELLRRQSRRIDELILPGAVEGWNTDGAVAALTIKNWWSPDVAGLLVPHDFALLLHPEYYGAGPLWLTTQLELLVAALASDLSTVAIVLRCSAEGPAIGTPDHLYETDAATVAQWPERELALLVRGDVLPAAFADANPGESRDLVPVVLELLRARRKVLVAPQSFPLELPRQQDAAAAIGSRLPAEPKAPLRALLATQWIECGGADKGVVDLLTRIHADAVEFRLLTTVAARHTWESRVRGYVREVVHLGASLPLPPEQRFPAFLTEYVRRRQIGLVHIMHSFLACDALPQLKRALPGVKVLDQCHILEPDHNMGGGHPAYASERYRQYFDHRTVTSQWLKRHLIQTYRIPENQVSVIYTGVDDQHEFNPERFARGMFRRRIGVPAAALLVAFVGRLHWQKRPWLFVRIAEQVQRRRPDMDAYFVLAGPGPERERVEAQLRALPQPQRVILAGEVAESAPVYRDADLLLMPSGHEGLAFVSFEAMAMGLPQVFTDVNAQGELITPDVGVLIPAEDEAACVAAGAEATIRLLDAPAHRAALAAAGRRRIREHFGIERMAAAYEQLYLTLTTR